MAPEQKYRPFSEQGLNEEIEVHKRWLDEGQKDETLGANLWLAKLEDIESPGVDLRLAKCMRFRVVRTNFEGSNFVRSNMEGAHITDSNMRKVLLRMCNLRLSTIENTSFDGADLDFANFGDSELLHSTFTHVTGIYCTFNGATISDANFEASNLGGAGFIGSILTSSNFRGANLSRCNFEGIVNPEDESNEFESADLTDTDLRETLLDDAVLSEVNGLQSRQLAGASLSNAKLPTDITEWSGLKHIEEISKHARGIFLAVIAACVFSWLTIATTTDAALLLNSATTPLPIIQTNVPIAGFYWFAPVILLALYFYLHFYLQSLWEGLASLPAIFPDGRTLDERAYPWMLNSLVQAHFKLLRDRRPAFSRTKVVFSILAAWWLVPFTLFLFWGRYIPRQDWIGSGFHILLLTLSVFLALTFYARARATLRLEDLPAFSWRSLVADIGNGVRLARSIAVGVLAAFLFLGVYWGKPVTQAGNLWQSFVSEAGFLIGFDPFPNAVEADLSVKGNNWRGFGKDEEMEAQFEQVKGAKLAGRRLQFADLSGAFLVKADLSLAKLRLAFLRRADLRRANLYRANLRWATMTETDLTGANLRGADLTGAFGLTSEQISRACVTDIHDQPILPVNVAGTKLRKCSASLFLY